MPRSLPALLLVVAVACAPEDDACAAAPFASPGPFVAGVTTLDVDGLAVEVWYPAESEAGTPRDVYDLRDHLPSELAPAIPDDAPTTFTTPAHRDVPVASGPFPVVYFSHGLGGYRRQSSAITAHLASWGFVVAAPEHAERNLATVLRVAMGTEGASISDDAYAQILAAHAHLASEARFAGALDLSRVAVMGHSAGGGAVQALVDRSPLEADAWIGMATVAAPQASTVPGLLLGGSLDQLATVASMDELFDHEIVASPARLVRIEGAGHLAFSDICVIGRERGGVLAIAQDAGLEIDELVVTLATDGCQPQALPAEDAWPIVGHYAVAHLRDALGVSTPATPITGLEPDAATCFGARIGRNDAR
ncbi:alpha/beta hydrolase family protein [Sandaracinus amylolyticus]|uniref:alpha/beta hydrolase family protein n=1 Tax=Sandaracinus amylolyticus TaxID=927083 RepID=UPI0009FB8A0D|nr:dienelactone hydrolase family protein [Sandaracinus amylolyticus]